MRKDLRSITKSAKERISALRNLNARDERSGPVILEIYTEFEDIRENLKLDHRIEKVARKYGYREGLRVLYRILSNIEQMLQIDDKDAAVMIASIEDEFAELIGVFFFASPVANMAGIYR